MKNVCFILFLCLLSIDCKHESPKKQVNAADLQTYFVSKAKKVDSLATVQEFKFIRIDTISRAQQYLGLAHWLDGIFKANANMIQSKLKLVKLNAEVSAMHRNIGSSMANVYANDAKEKYQEVNELMKNNDLLIEDMKILKTMADTADRKKPVAFRAINLYSLKKKDASVQKDTARIMLDVDLNIMDGKTYDKVLKGLYVTKYQFKE